MGSETPERLPDAGAAAQLECGDGVDVTLVRWTLSLTPEQRLKLLQANADALGRLRDAAEAQR